MYDPRWGHGQRKSRSDNGDRSHLLGSHWAWSGFHIHAGCLCFPCQLNSNSFKIKSRFFVLSLLESTTSTWSKERVPTSTSWSKTSSCTSTRSPATCCYLGCVATCPARSPARRSPRWPTPSSSCSSSTTPSLASSPASSSRSTWEINYLEWPDHSHTCGKFP